MNEVEEICEKLKDVEQWLHLQQKEDNGLKQAYAQMMGTITSIRMRLLTGITKGERT